MDIYLIRHTTPDVAKGICYGQTDLDVTNSFHEEVRQILPHLPVSVNQVISSPLQRCRKLAEALFPGNTITVNPHLMELDCGSWEMQEWNNIPKPEIQPWLDNLIHTPVPGGESYAQMHDRVINAFEEVRGLPGISVIVAHGGVLRSIVAHITGTDLLSSFDVFSFNYGSVVGLRKTNDGITHEILYNHSRAGKEWHRPSDGLGRQ
jgi:alpha-ribazole phosphatase